MGGRGSSSASSVYATRAQAEGQRVRAAMSEAAPVIFALQGLGYDTLKPASELLYGGKGRHGAVDEALLRQGRAAYESVMKKMGYAKRDQLDSQIKAIWFG